MMVEEHKSKQGEMMNQNDAKSWEEWAKRRMAAWKALPEPRVPWEQFKRTWKENKGENDEAVS